MSVSVSLTASAALGWTVWLFVIVLVSICFSIWYMKIELNLHGLKKTVVNKFVIPSVLMVIFAAFAALLEAVDLILTYRTAGTSVSLNQLIFWTNFFFICSIALHIYLLHLRTISVLQHKEHAITALKVYAGVIQIAGLVHLIGCGVASFQPSVASVKLYEVSRYIYSVGVLILDVFCTSIFVWEIRQHKKALTESRTKTLRIQDDPTDIIARTGIGNAGICFVATITLVVTSFSPFVITLLCMSAWLWLILKLRLERIAQLGKKDQPTDNSPKNTAVEQKTSQM
jgi:hypothetical protein